MPTGKDPNQEEAPFQSPLVKCRAGQRVQTHEDIATRAYYCWQERGCPDGSPDVDWRRAEEELQAGEELG